MDETRKLTAEEFEKVKNSGKYTQEQLEKIKDMEIPVNINELSDEQLENAAGGFMFESGGHTFCLLERDIEDFLRMLDN